MEDAAVQALGTVDFRDLAESCPLGLFQLDAQGHCVWANAHWQVLFGLTLEQALGAGWLQAVHAADAGVAQAMWHRPVDATLVERVLRLRAGSGAALHVRVRATPRLAAGGALQGYAACAMEITEEVSSQEGLQASNDFLARAEEIAGVGGWRFDLRTQLLLWTSNMRRIHDLPADYVPRGDEHVKYFPAAARKQIERIVQAALRDGDGWDVQLPMTTAAGREIWVRSVGQVERADGKPIAAVGVLHDITESRAARAALLLSEERLHRALENSGLALWDLDVQTGTLYLSATWSLMLGGPAEETYCTAADLLSLVAPADLAHLQAQLGRVLAGEQELYAVEHRVQRRDGETLWIHSEGRVAERDAQGNALRMVGTNRDVTAQRRHEQELLVARDAADAASNAKSLFLATMSHEIRTPLNGIIGLARLLLDEKLTPELRRHADLINRSAHSLLSLVNDILDVSRIEAGQMEIESVAFDLHELLQDLANLYQLRATEKSLLFRLRIAPDVPRFVEADPTRLRQVLVNLLGNALKFTSSGWIGLDVRTSRRAELQLEFGVSDTGMGIAPEVLPQLFTPFTQADSTTSRKFGGSGLGLSIVRQLVALMGGSLRVRSQPGAGSRFTACVPIQLAEAPSAPAPLHEQVAAAQGSRLLVVEDNTTNQVVAFGMLRKLGFDDISLASDGAQACAMVADEDFDLILMDCQMPEMDGYEATRRLRATGCRSVIVAMTANAIKGDRERCLEAGMDDYITKPIDLRVLQEVLARWTPAVVREQPVFDPGELAQRMGGDSELVAAALTIFVGSTPALLDKLQSARASEDRVLLALHAHSLKGSSTMVCAGRLAATAAALEEGAHAVPLAELGELVAQAREEFAELAQVLRETLHPG